MGVRLSCICTTRRDDPNRFTVTSTFTNEPLMEFGAQSRQASAYREMIPGAENQWHCQERDEWISAVWAARQAPAVERRNSGAMLTFDMEVDDGEHEAVFGQHKAPCLLMGAGL